MEVEKWNVMKMANGMEVCAGGAECAEEDTAVAEEVAIIGEDHLPPAFPHRPFQV